MPVLYQRTVTPPAPPPPPPYLPAEVHWLGRDGSWWDLVRGPARLVAEGVRGLNLPTWDLYGATSPTLAGSRHRGSRVRDREVRLTVYLEAPDTASYVSLEREWFASFDPDEPGQLVVTVEGVDRWLWLRLSEVDDAMTVDPTLAGWAVYGLTLLARQPLWEAEDITRRFTSGTTRPFFSTSGSVLGICPGSTLSTATMTNPGDEPAWPVWTVHGPCDSLTVGVGSVVVDLDITLTDTQTLTIDTRPGRQRIVDGTGTNRAGDATVARFAPIPAGASVPLNLAATGVDTGFSVSATITPLYRRAWS
jgi:hypothetical protein